MAETQVGVTVLIHAPGLDQRTIRRALARGLQAEGWQPTLPYDQTVVAPADEVIDLLASLLKLRSEQRSIPSTLLQLDDPDAIRQLKMLVYKPADSGHR